MLTRGRYTDSDQVATIGANADRRVEMMIIVDSC